MKTEAVIVYYKSGRKHTLQEGSQWKLMNRKK